MELNYQKNYIHQMKNENINILKLLMNFKK
jgi:hypothetical protein